MAIALDSRNVVRGRQSEALPDVEVAAAILRACIVAVLGEQSKTIQRAIVEAVSESVTGRERQPVRSPLGHSNLQAVEVGMDVVSAAD